MPDASLVESLERIKVAARNTGVPLANRKLTVNLSPATLPKFGSSFDVAILIAALAADRQITPASNTMYLAELGLYGSLKPVPGVLPAMQLARSLGINSIVVAEANRAEAELVPDMKVFAAEHLGQVLMHCGAQPEVLVMNLRHQRPSAQGSGMVMEPDLRDHDLALVNGQGEARLALEIAAGTPPHDGGAGRIMSLNGNAADLVSSLL